MPLGTTLTYSNCSEFNIRRPWHFHLAGTGATIIPRQLPLTSWHKYLVASYPTTADALLDHMITNSVKIDLRGESPQEHKDPVLGKESI